MPGGGAAGCGAAACASSGPDEQSVPETRGAPATAPFRQEHVSIREHLGHAQQWTARLRNAPPAEQRRLMTDVVSFFQHHIVPHAQWEERALYPVVDRHAGSAPAHPFTSTMRHEHTIVGRWTAELAAEAAKPAPDPDAFAQRANHLLGLVAAHFEEEEEVLLPVLDAAMTPEQFRAEVLGDEHAGH